DDAGNRAGAGAYDHESHRLDHRGPASQLQPGTGRLRYASSATAAGSGSGKRPRKRATAFLSPSIAIAPARSASGSERPSKINVARVPGSVSTIASAFSAGPRQSS